MEKYKVGMVSLGCDKNRVDSELILGTINKFYEITNNAKEADINKNINPTTLRHSFAIHLLNGGANVAVVSKILGNSNLSSLQLYLKYIDKNLRKEIKAKHPRENDINFK